MTENPLAVFDRIDVLVKDIAAGIETLDNDKHELRRLLVAASVLYGEKTGRNLVEDFRETGVVP